MYKIVETIEENEKTLCVVPSSWEKNKILYWPPGRKSMTMRKDHRVMPDPKTWSKQPCSVKRSNFTSFENALQVEKKLSQFSDTEEEERFHNLKGSTTNSVRRRTTLNATSNIEEDFNYLLPASVPAVVNSAPLPSLRSATTVLPPPANNFIGSMATEQALEGPVIIQNFMESTSQASNSSDTNIVVTDGIYEVPHMNFSSPQLEEDINDLLKKHEQLSHDVLELKKEVSGLHTKFDKLIEIMQKYIPQEKQTCSASINYGNKSVILNLKKLLPISKEDHLNELESILKTSEVVASDFINYMSEIGGTSGTKNGTKIAYMVADRIFSRSFLTECSWTGSSKSNEKKIAFLKYTSIFDNFFKIIRLADTRYSVDDMESFFHRILKNSVSRFNQTTPEYNSKRKRKCTLQTQTSSSSASDGTSELVETKKVFLETCGQEVCATVTESTVSNEDHFVTEETKSNPV